VRATTLLNRLLALPEVTVRGVSFGDAGVAVEVGLRRRRLVCPHCQFSTRARYDTRPVPSISA